MLPRMDGGVVDPQLIVYGTRNLRVVSQLSLSLLTHIRSKDIVLHMKVDASILPFVSPPGQAGCQYL